MTGFGMFGRFAPSAQSGFGTITPRSFSPRGGTRLIGNPGSYRGSTRFTGGPVHGRPAPGSVPGTLGGAPGAPGAPGGSAAPSTVPPYYDSTALGNIYGNAFKVGNDINAINLRDAIANSTLQGNLGTLAYQQPRADLALEQRANSGGGLYSSVYNQNLGNLNTSFQDRATAAQSAYANQLAQDASQIQGLQGSIPIFNAQQSDAAVQRAAMLAAKNPASGESAAPLTAAQRLAAAVAKPSAPVRGARAVSMLGNGRRSGGGRGSRARSGF